MAGEDDCITEVLGYHEPDVVVYNADGGIVNDCYVDDCVDVENICLDWFRMTL